MKLHYIRHVLEHLLRETDKLLFGSIYQIIMGIPN